MQQRRSPEFLWHSHPGPVIVYVTEGELVYAPAEGLLTTQLPGRDRVRRPGSRPRPQRFNPTDEETALVATFFDAPAQGPLLIPAQAPQDCDI